MKKNKHFVFAMALFSLCTFLGCEPEGPSRGRTDTAPSGTDEPSGTDSDTLPPTLGCGDRILTEDEACDDGNMNDGDGCAGNCRSVDVGYSCNPPGAPCQKVARCGDGIQVLPELCDDGNDSSGDGCSRTCKVEIGFKCDGMPSDCTETECGDTKIEGAEGCDDGNAVPLDGCDENCQPEPTCAAGSSCTSACGDGLLIDEDCDDGNTIDGDGCSSDCTIEDGFECEQESIDTSLVVPIVYRDFLGNHPDFQTGLDVSGTGFVGSELGDDGNPVMTAKSSQAGISKLDEWYTDGPGRITVVDTLTLTPSGSNYSYINCGFFPLENAGYTPAEEPRQTARYPAGCQDSNWEIVTGGGQFSFTSEVRFWFEYTGDHTLTFIGDDDVWVFVNGKIAVDLGGVHTPQTGSITLAEDGYGPAYGLELGKVYEIVVFQAERNPEGSSYQLTLSGFNTSRSECLPICGDGEVGLGEECDDGVNDGGYGECGEGCQLDEYCGDGKVQDQEDCDPADPETSENCPNSCRIIVID